MTNIPLAQGITPAGREPHITNRPGIIAPMQQRPASPTPPRLDSADVTPRHHHYGEFYGLAPRWRERTPGAIRICVIGNCQAESQRILLDSTGLFDSFRIPPVHEWDELDVHFARTAMADCDVLVTQAIRDDYRGLPCGDKQLARFLPAHGTVVRYPALRYSGMNPAITIIRVPQDTSLDPPVVPYHDLHNLAAFAGVARTGSPNFDATMQLFLHELRVREVAHGCVEISDVVAEAPRWHTVNHPDNATLMELARRVARRILEVSAGSGASGGSGTSGRSGTSGAEAALPQVHDPGRELLGGIDAPEDPQATAHWGVDNPRTAWVDHGADIPVDQVWEAQREFYRQYPDAVTEGLRRHAPMLRALGYDA
ncbi:hypothetical protein CFAL_02010 [Corynebacterium falsenii DSM 44353]|uniref:WcbI family polysaccharide biosynthesis putative acetyltransferase n=1 Tax=Corynebacterium falsenii TaxID=108486 RepID=UPI0003E9330F|nr:WcbI family polysaccharide biosynthesis putative acetyltransferase [Corynebacterium falsenii]AHI02534.1 hypothetical protein CFAL_02010 [Corynebacterium falsenii DSM 44353]UBI05312.1 hypothetical protein LA343_03955 [Corynebacterium falsenii]